MAYRNESPPEPLILCVDDEPHVLRALQRMLIRHGCRVVLAANGKEALKVLAGEHVAAVVCDEAMPGMRGVEVLEQAKAISPRTARVLLTAHCGNEQVVIKAVNESEIFRILPKPWNEEDILRVISEALGMSPFQWRVGQEKMLARLPQPQENEQLWFG